MLFYTVTLNANGPLRSTFNSLSKHMENERKMEDAVCRVKEQVIIMPIVVVMFACLVNCTLV